MAMNTGISQNFNLSLDLKQRSHQRNVNDLETKSSKVFAYIDPDSYQNKDELG